jgi:hypothetical protein
MTRLGLPSTRSLFAVKPHIVVSQNLSVRVFVLIRSSVVTI